MDGSERREAGTLGRDEAAPSIGLARLLVMPRAGRSGGAVLRDLRGGAAAGSGRPLRPARAVTRLRGRPGAARSALLRAAAAAASRPLRDPHGARAGALAEQATALNEAYETLKDPLRRADYPAAASACRQSRRLQPGQRSGAADRSARDARGAGRGRHAAEVAALEERPAATSTAASTSWPMPSPPTTSKPRRGWRPGSSTCASSPTTAGRAG